MFLKPFTVKTNAKIKSSDKKHLLQSFCTQYVLEMAHGLPTPLESADVFRLKLATHSGIHVTVFVFDGQPMLWEYEGRLLPTLCLLWLLPDLLFHFKVHKHLIVKLSSGADLMIPGLVVEQPITGRSFDGIVKGVWCAISTVDNKAPIAVGYTAMSSEEMSNSRGRGKAVIIQHVVGDYICALNPSVSRPLLPWNPEIPSELEQDKIDDVCLHSDNAMKVKEDSNSDELKECEESPDNIVRRCFLRSLKLISNKSLPMPVNVFYAQHVLAQKPFSVQLDIKKTSYKKVGVFLKAMQADGLVQLDEPKPGVIMLRSVMRDHDELRHLRMDMPPGDNQTQCSNVPPSSKIDWPAGYFGPPTIEDVRLITGPLCGLFNKVNSRYISQSDARKLVDQYVREHKLQRPEDPSSVNPDQLLMQICDPKQLVEAPESSLSKPVFVINFQNLLSSALRRLPVVYRIIPPLSPAGASEPLIWSKPQPPNIYLSTASRNGKKVTHVKNLSLFFIDPDAFAKRLQVTLACSVGRADEAQFVNQPPVIQAQGHHDVAISKIITETYAIPKRYINGYVEASRKAKKKGK